MMIFLYSLIFLYIIYFDLIPLIRKKEKYLKLVIFNTIILLLSFTIIVFVGLDLKFPNPNNLIEEIVKAITG